MPSTTTKMPFGKYKGLLLTEIPDDYLLWLASGDIELRPWLWQAVIDEQKRRAEPPTKTTAPTVIDKEIVQRIVKLGYRTLAKQCHPDHGGTHEDMLKINLTYEWLEANLDSLLSKR